MLATGQGLAMDGWRPERAVLESRTAESPLLIVFWKGSYYSLSGFWHFGGTRFEIVALRGESLSGQYLSGQRQCHL